MAIRLTGASPALKPNTKYSRAMNTVTRLFATSCLGLLICGSTGCTMTSGIGRALNKSDCIDNFMIDYRNRALAEKAWHCQKEQFCNRKHQREFKAGFIAGFIDVASGGNGCTPTVAPSCYWGWRYQSAQGQKAVNEWFAGYPMGVRAGEQAGVGNWHEIGMGNVGTPVMVDGVPTEMMHGQTSAPNPFYSSDNAGPGTMTELHSPSDMPMNDEGGIMQPVPDVTNHEFPINMPADEMVVEDDLVSRFEVADQAEASIAKLSDQPQLPVDNEVNVDIFAPSNSTDAALSPVVEDDSELPFSFE